MKPQSDPDTFAALDLGSNSFHMVIARSIDGELRIVDRVRERVQLAAGIGADKLLAEDVQQRAIACLDRMGQRVRHMAPGHVRAVGTNSLRRARNARAFLRLAEGALGRRIEVISGQEEARLIYLGVAHSSADDAGRRLVVDIGGGSTECILGERFEVARADSLHMGCVSYSLAHFPGGELKKSNLRRATIAARVELQPIELRFRALGWTTCIGASGTIRAIAEILRVNGWTDGAITAPGLKRLRKALIAAGDVDSLALDGLKPERAPVLPGGYAILQALFDGFKIERLDTTTGALREGVLYDLVGRNRHEDVRDRTIRRFVERYHVDEAHAARVEVTALHLLDRVEERWGLEGSVPRQLLAWAARLHEVGIVVRHSAYHKHGAYLLQSSYMPGFSNDEQQILGALVRVHRRKLPPVGEIPDLPPLGLTGLLRLCVLLRLAVLLNRSRSPEPIPAFFLEADVGKLRLVFPKDYLEQRSLPHAGLVAEAKLLAERGFELTVE